MSYIAPSFTPSVTISGSDLIKDTDEKLQTIANEVGDYFETETKAIYADLDAQMTVIENDYNTVLKHEIEQKMDDLLSVNPDGTYYTKSAIDALVASKVPRITSTDNQLARFDGTSGAIQGSGVVVDDNGNLGVGVTPSAWYALNVKVLDVGTSTALWDWAGETRLFNNSYMDGMGDYRYKNNGYAGWYNLDKSNGFHSWYVAPSGTAGSPLTWTTALRIPNTGGIQLPNTAITGATTLDWYEEATATLTATGMTTAPTGTCELVRIGKSVSILLPTFDGTSNSVSFSLGTLPINFRPSTIRQFPAKARNNGNVVDCNIRIQINGTIEIFIQQTTVFSQTGWTPLGSKTLYEISATYHI